MLEKKYNHLEVEKDLYNFWLEKEYFKSNDKTKDPFCIVIPPPNVTGKLHLGHAWDTTLQDIIIRYKKMNGFDTLWLPGMDHAGIATQAKVDERLRKDGINPRSLTREDWLKHAWGWKEEYAQTIRKQWAKLGLSLDYSKERFTLDEGLNDAVTKVFIDYYNKGLIYRGKRIINWDPIQQTALSNEEVIYKDIEGAFYHIKYMIEGTKDYLEIATTRPETLFGDTAVAVNKDDERYKNLIGKNVILPIVNKPIPVIADEHADMEFGTGVVKITPAHDPNDFEVGQRHNLQRVICINPDATMNENAGIYNKMDRFEAREKLVEDLKKQDLLIKIEKIKHSVGHSERSGVVVEPYLSNQWFVKMRPLANRVLEMQKTKDKVNFVPKRFEKTLNHWMEISYDWCISRQLWWGHRIPAYYKGDEIYVGTNPPAGFVQDEDVLDTWFSSALWPFSTLGWPNETEDYKRYFPNDCLVTGFDIIFFWVARMIFSSLELTDKIPFNDCVIHGLIRDKQGRKMSKSLGNGVDPMEEIQKYGADSLRYFLATSSAPGMDLRYDEEKVKSTWNFINKIYNASRYVLMNLEDFKEENKTLENLKEEDKWILNRLNEEVKIITKHMDKYEFNIVGTHLYNFIWSDFCDNYIELSKRQMDNTTKTVLFEVLTNILKLLHPFMPHVTEVIYQKLPIHNESIMITNYPTYKKEYIYNNNFKTVIEDISKIRNLKKENNIEKNTYYEVKTTEELKEIYNFMLKLTDNNTKKPTNSKEFKYNSNNITITFFRDNTLTDKEKQEIQNELEKLNKNIKSRENLLNNKNYINNAPKELVEKEQKTLEEQKNKKDILISRLK